MSNITEMEYDQVEFNENCYQEILRSLLNKEGFRLTHQRQQVLDAIKDIPDGHHLSAEEIYQILADRGEGIGIATIYRTLHLMVDLGFLREIGFSESKRYYELSTPFTSQHHHLVCVQCGEVKEFDNDQISLVSIQEAEDKGFSLLKSQFNILGLCPDCQRQQGLP